MGNQIQDYFCPLKTVIASVPPRHQHQNGLVERNWRSILRMACSWMTTSLLPSSFWYYAVKRAIEVSNYLPVAFHNHTTSSFEIVHHQKPDIRNLFPLSRDGNSTTESMGNRSLRVIAVGKSEIANCLDFYHPPTKQIYTSAVYKLDPTLAAGPLFNLAYDGGLFFNVHHNDEDIHRVPTYTPRAD